LSLKLRTIETNWRLVLGTSWVDSRKGWKPTAL